MALVTTKDSNPNYSAYDIRFSAQTNTQYQNHSFYRKPMLGFCFCRTPTPRYFLRGLTTFNLAFGGLAGENKDAILKILGVVAWHYKWIKTAHTFPARVASPLWSCVFISIHQINDFIHSTAPSLNHPGLFPLVECKIAAHFCSGLVGGVVTALLLSTHWLWIIDMLSQASSGLERRHSSE